MTYPERIKEAKHRLEILEVLKTNFQNSLRELKVGETIYMPGGHDEEYFPQIITEINVDECWVKAFEDSTNIETKFISFHMKQNNEFIYHE